MTSLAIVLLLAWPRPAAAQASLSPAGEAQLDEGLRRLYALDYARSRAAFRKLIELEPDNPSGYLFEAGGIWWESSQEFGLFQDTPTLQGLFEADVDAALRKADAYIESGDPQKRADGYFVSGMALGTLGQWRLMKGHWLEAYLDGKKAVKHLKKCLKLDKNYIDAELGLGVFDYQTAHLSGAARLGMLFGLKGNEKRGLENIRLAMEKSRYSRRQAAQLLAQIYIVDKRDDVSALPVVQSLRRDFPESPYFLFLESMVRSRLGDRDGSLALGRELYSRIAADPAAFHQKWLTLVCGLSGPRCLSPGDAEAALAWLDRALETVSGDAPSGFAALLRLLRGQALDALGRRAEAGAEYRKCLALPDFDFAHERATACLAAHCGRAEQLRRLRALSQEEPGASPRGNGIVIYKR